MSDSGAPTGLPPPMPLKVDRQRTTPFLLKLFYRRGSFNRLDDFSRTSTLPRDYIIIYTWRDCTLSELCSLISDALPSVCPARSRVGFKLVFADTRYPGLKYLAKELGFVTAGQADEASGRLTLDEAQFVVGDWIDVGIWPEGWSVGAGAAGGGMGGGAPAGPRGFGGGMRGPRGGMMEDRNGGSSGGGGYQPPPMGSGFRVRGGSRGGHGGFGDRLAGVPSGDWRRGENVDEGVGGMGMDRPMGGMGRGGGRFGGRGGGMGGMGGGRRYRD